MCRLLHVDVVGGLEKRGSDLEQAGLVASPPPPHTFQKRFDLVHMPRVYQTRRYLGMKQLSAMLPPSSAKVGDESV